MCRLRPGIREWLLFSWLSSALWSRAIPCSDSTEWQRRQGNAKVAARGRLGRSLHKSAVTVNSIPWLPPGNLPSFSKNAKCAMVFGRRPLAKRGQWPRYEGFFKLFPFPRILPNGNKPSAHFRHLVPAEWRSYSAVAVASSVRDQREDGQCCGHVGRPPAGGGRIGGRTAPPPASKNVANWQTQFFFVM